MNLAYICSIGVGPILSTWPRSQTAKTNTMCFHLDGLVQEGRNSIANALEPSTSCTTPSIWTWHTEQKSVLYCSCDHGHSQPNTLVGCGSMSGWSLCIDLQPLVIHRANDGPCWQTLVYSNVTHPHTAHRATATVTCTKWRWLSARLQQLHC